MSAPADKWVGHTLDAGPGDIAVDRGHVLAWCEATENANPLYWDAAAADELTGGWVAPPTMLSVWMRPLLFHPEAGERTRPLELHFRLKDALDLPEGIVAANEITFAEPVRMGDVISTRQTVREIGEVRTSRLGTGRSWTIDVAYTNQRGQLVGVETYRMFSYRRDATPPAETGERPARHPAEPASAAPPVVAAAGRPRTVKDVVTGERLPTLAVPVTARTVVMGAAASRDWQPQHHDHAWAVDKVGPRGIFLNTPSQAGWIERFLTDWSGSLGRLGMLRFRMRATVCPGDELRFGGVVTAVHPEGWVDLDVVLEVADQTVTDCAARLAVPAQPGDNPWQWEGWDPTLAGAL